MNKINDKLIKKWVDEGTISPDQARKMSEDVTANRKEETSSKLIVTISTIGSLLLGIGAILFISANWQSISSLGKVLLLLASTFGAYYAGYVLKYEKKNLPKVGDSLIFLGALLFGASVFLIAQIYNINANNHSLLLIWLAGVLPMVYGFYSIPIAALSALLFLAWIGFYIFRNADFYIASRDFNLFPALYLVIGILLFNVGGIHYLWKELKGVARTYRLIAIKTVMVSLFLLTFEWFSRQPASYGYYHSTAEGWKISTQFTAGFVLFAIASLLCTVGSLFFRPVKSDTDMLENGIGLGLIGIAFLFFFFPSTVSIYTLLFNLIMAGLTLTVLVVGYRREDMTLVNIGMGWGGFFILVKYFDFFWSLLPRSLFFMVGGLILVFGGISLERKRRELGQKFSKTE
ncbi:MAG: DUF2157 domain-containing protein [Candidatus Omnitrophota bacterium]|nr:DUF2157 domain-containing protein [Candidatus Omnitrophota bacterium]MDZ4242334.1 DUF2157 domain-containing protein [Candidatus Omnitrophota bacterium]